MTDPSNTPPKPVQLPREFIDRLTPPFVKFFHVEATGGAVLLFFTIAAVALANSPWEKAFLSIWDTRLGFQFGAIEYGRSLREWINEGLMTLFFFLVMLELKREIVLGEMRNPRMAALPIAAAVGGMAVPAVIYTLLLWGKAGQHGWGIVMPTDTAFVIACLALLGTRIPHSLRVFMLFLAIADDIGAILVVAFGYSDHLHWHMLVVAAVIIVLVRLLAQVGIRNSPIYFCMGGAIWLAIDASGLHATITGVILGLMTPARRWVSDSRLYSILGQVVAHPAGSQGSHHTDDRETLQDAETAARESLSPVERLEIALHPWVSFGIMPLFAFANAGVALSWDRAIQPVATAVFLGFAAGKPTGILLFGWLALRLRIAVRPADLRWGVIMGGGFLAGIGFTMALFITDLALVDPLMSSAKIGIFTASLFSATVGIALLMRAR